MGFGSTGGGSASIAGATDTTLNNPLSSEVLTYDGGLSMWKNDALADRQLMVRWSGTAWPARPVGASFGVLFLSTNDANAPAPTDANLATGDVWRRHPDAE